MTMLAPASGGTPDTILGASLTDWFDASAGVTLVGARVSDWENQSVGSNAVQSIDGNRPTYIASGADDGTPELDFPRLNDGFDFGGLVPDAFTCWVLIKSPSSLAGCLLISEAHTGKISLWPQGYPSANRPSIYDGSWHDQATANIVGWHVIRFSVRDNGVGLSTIAVDDGAEETTPISNVPAGTSWTYLSRTINNHSIYGQVKQIIIANQYKGDADGEHAAILAYLKDLYPTLVTY